jgi:hypothetical protein
MRGMHGIVASVVGATLVIALAACGPESAREVESVSGRPGLPAVSATATPQPPGEVVWGKVPYCNCLADTATANVAAAFQQANLTVNLKELSPREGWLYFAVRFDPETASSALVRATMEAGGAEVLDGPP